LDLIPSFNILNNENRIEINYSTSKKIDDVVIINNKSNESYFNLLD
jgi:sporulation protein YlmC with PRC-barrel domain